MVCKCKHKYYKGLGTSTPKEAKDYFRNLSTHLYDIEYTEEQTDCIDMAFNKKEQVTEERGYPMYHQMPVKTLLPYKNL